MMAVMKVRFKNAIDSSLLLYSYPDSDLDLDDGDSQTVKVLRSVKFRGILLSSANFSQNNSNVFLNEWEGQRLSRQIFQIQEIRQKDTEIELSLQKYKEVEEATDIYARYPLLRAKLWSNQLDGENIKVKADKVRCHGGIWKVSSDTMVAVILDRVSSLMKLYELNKKKHLVGDLALIGC
jgi:hypothetical protein